MCCINGSVAAESRGKRGNGGKGRVSDRHVRIKGTFPFTLFHIHVIKSAKCENPM